MVQQRGKQVHDLYQVARTANSRVAPDGTRLQAREQQLTSEISEARNRTTDHQDQLQSLELEFGPENFQHTNAKVAGT